MGFFNRKSSEESLVPAPATLVEQPAVSAGELEQMVYATFQEKLELERKLEQAAARISALEEQATKLKAAETFSRKSEAERMRADTKNDELRERNSELERQVKQARAKVTTLELKINDLKGADNERMAAYRRELVEEMQRHAVCASGGWSKSRVLDFLAGFLPDTEEVSSYDSSFVETRDEEPEPRRSAKKPRWATDTPKTPKDGHSGHENRRDGEERGDQ